MAALNADLATQTAGTAIQLILEKVEQRIP
jgi:hypothetical protein